MVRPGEEAAEQSRSPLVYVSIVTWNDTDKTLACIDDVRNQTYRNFRILVVDNASQPSCVEHLESRLPDVELLKNNHNTGYAGGHLLSVERAKGGNADLLWILNNDARIRPDTLERLVAAYRRHGNGIYGGVPLDRPEGGGRQILIHRKYLTPNFRQMFFRPDRYRRYDDLFGVSKDPIRVSAVSGSCLMLPLSTIDTHGFMDTNYFLYAEEIDYCFRLSNAGVPVWLVPGATITHESEGSSSGRSSVLGDLIQYYRTRNQLIFIQRHGSTWNTISAQTKNILLAAYFLICGRARRARFILCGMLDGALGRLGKTYAPEDYR